MERRFLAIAFAVAMVTAFAGTSPAAATFAGTNGRLAFSRNGNIFAVDPDGTDRVRLTNTGRDWAPTWSPDGMSIAFIRGSDTDAVWVMDADGTDARRVSDRGWVEPPFWSPDGSAIAYSMMRDTQGRHRAIFVATPDGTSRRQLTAYRFMNMVTGWSPTGSKLLFVSDRDGDDEIWTMSAHGTAVTRLTRNTVMDLGASFSPDGSSIVFYRATPDAHRTAIWVMNGDGTHERQLTTVRGYDMSPEWSPDGTWIAFDRVARTAGNIVQQVFLISATGSDLHAITPTDVRAIGFTWAPDSTEVAYRASDTSSPDALIGVEVVSSDGTPLGTAPTGYALPDWQAL